MSFWKFLDPDYDPDCQQNLITLSLGRALSRQKNLSKFFQNLSNLADRKTDKQRQTDVQANRQTSKNGGITKAMSI